MSANFSPDLVGYSGIKPFRFWCQKVLPLTYDDSLSYYELLCKVVNYVNHLIEDVSSAETNIDALKEAYDELEGYVNNYFDNLDVQEEINNKLDTMAANGTLKTLMEPYFNTLSNGLAQANSDIGGLTRDLATLDARVTNLASLTEGSTTGDAELADIRVGGNGITYDSAGDAVRAQYGINHQQIYSDNNSTVSNINQQVYWEQGNIDSTGANTPNASRIRTIGYVPTSAVYFNCNGGYGVTVKGYNAGGEYIGELNSSQDNFVSNGSGFASINIGDVYKKFPGVRLRLTIYPFSGSANPTPSTAANFTLTNSILKKEESTNFRVCQYNIGKFNWGISGGLPAALVDTKVANYKEFLGQYKPDMICMQEYVNYVDENETVTAASIFDPLYRSHSEIGKEAVFYTNNVVYRTGNQWIQTSGDPSANASWGLIWVGGRRIMCATGYLNVAATLDQKKAAINNLMRARFANEEYGIISYDMNALSKDEADGLKAYLATFGFKTANWDYFGYKNTYKLTSEMYKSIDNIAVKGDIKIRSLIVPDVYANLSSDHFPVIVDLAIN